MTKNKYQKIPCEKHIRNSCRCLTVVLGALLELDFFKLILYIILNEFLNFNSNFCNFKWKFNKRFFWKSLNAGNGNNPNPTLYLKALLGQFPEILKIIKNLFFSEFYKFSSRVFSCGEADSMNLFSDSGVSSFPLRFCSDNAWIWHLFHFKIAINCLRKFGLNVLDVRFQNFEIC